MNKIVACVEYDGSRYYGWQKQGHSKNTIQEKVEDALSVIANESIIVHCAGRTDSGVHATMQVVHFETSANRNERSWVRGANTKLPNDIAIKWIKPVDDSFHARFLATSREYQYVIDNSPLISGAINRQRTTWEYRPLNVNLMQQASEALLGEHDFTSFRASNCQSKTPAKTIIRLELSRTGNFIVLTIEANAFLHHMVRNIAGVLMDIGAGEQKPEWCTKLLQAKDRRVAGVTAKPHGLYLTRVNYPEKYHLPSGRSGIILIS